MAEHHGETAAHPEPPEWFTDAHLTVAEALWADTWTEPKPQYGPEWHHRFQWWMCVAAARLVVEAQEPPKQRRHRRIWHVAQPTSDGSQLYAVTCSGCRYSPPAAFGRPEWARQFYDRAHSASREVPSDE